jgi:hypothetical protein
VTTARLVVSRFGESGGLGDYTALNELLVTVVFTFSVCEVGLVALEIGPALAKCLHLINVVCGLLHRHLLVGDVGLRDANRCLARGDRETRLRGSTRTSG